MATIPGTRANGRVVDALRFRRRDIFWATASAVVLAFIILVHSGTLATAHSRWFLVDYPLPAVTPITFDFIYAGLIAAAVALVASALILDRLVARRVDLARYFNAPVKVPYAFDWRLLSTIFGMTLIINSMTDVFVAPDLPLSQGMFGALIAFAQIVLGAMYVIQARLLLAGILTIAILPVACCLLRSFPYTADYLFELMGLGGALLLVAPLISIGDKQVLLKALRNLPATINLNTNTVVGRLQLHWQASAGGGEPVETWRCGHIRLAANFLRLMLGLQLIVLAVHDKLIFPAPAIAFLEKYSFVNFPMMLGYTGFTNEHFVLGAGFIEIAFGVMLFGNVATRATSAVLFAIFTLTGLVFGIDELVGHLPIMAALLVLFLAGSQHREISSRASSSWRPAFWGASVSAMAVVVAAFVVNAPSRAAPPAANSAALLPEIFNDHLAVALSTTEVIQLELENAGAGAGALPEADERAQRIDSDSFTGTESGLRVLFAPTLIQDLSPR